MDQDKRYEEERLQHVKNVIEQKLTKFEENIGILKKDANDLRKEFRNDTKINLDSWGDKLETYASLLQQSNTLAIKEQTQRHVEKQHKVFLRLIRNPYFARVDFKEDDSDVVTPIYIGISTLREHEHVEDSFLIYDWRAPISSIYYDHVPGPAFYEFGGEKFTGEMFLKRQFILKNGQILSMFDTSLAIGDELLKEILGNQANIQMKSIVATIQKEQNQIIRQTKSPILIIQGAAGSGKTSVALQRVAYLLYQSQYKLNSENMILFSPNPIFSSYVSTVLPEMGEDNIRQMTFQEYVESRVGKAFDLESPFEQMEFILSEKDQPIYQTRKESIRIKSSIPFKEWIDSYVLKLSQGGLLFKNISFREEILIDAKEIQHYFYSLKPASSISSRIKETADWLLNEIQAKEIEEYKKDWVLEEIELLDSYSYIDNYKELEKEKRFSENTFDDFEREKNLLIRKMVREQFMPIRRAVKELLFVHIPAIYCQLFTDENTQYAFQTNKNWKDICSFTTNQIRRKKLFYEDQAPYLYLMDKLVEKKVDRTIKHLFIDEAQDYSPIQFHVLRQLYPSSKLTILGDFNQAIFSQSYEAPTMLTTELYGELATVKMTLTTSYRSTKQIVDFSKQILSSNSPIEAFDRNGALPTLTKVTTMNELYDGIVLQLQKLKQDYETIAVICKTATESLSAYEILSKSFECQLVNEKSRAFRKGITILPCYLAKGVEFDAVVIYNASKDVYAQDIERNILYTSCTRAMHELHLFSVGEWSDYILSISEETYVMK